MFALHRRVYSTVYSVLSKCLWKKSSHATRAGFEPTTSCLPVQTSQPFDHRACPMTIGRLESYIAAGSAIFIS